SSGPSRGCCRRTASVERCSRSSMTIAGRSTAIRPSSRRLPSCRRNAPVSTSYVYGTGRRKEAVARVRLLPGDGSIIVNGKDAADYFGGTPGLATLRLPFRVTETEGRYSASVLV